MRLLPSLFVLMGMGGLAWAGHEVAVYPSYYPHEILIEAMTPAQAAPLLGAATLHAYLGPEPSFSGAAPAGVRAIESFGGWVVVRLNPQRTAGNEAPSCALLDPIVGSLSDRDGFVFHPYPVTPWHGDYLYHVDQAEAEKTRLLDQSVAPHNWRIKAAAGSTALVRPEWRTTENDWDATIEPVDIAEILDPARRSLNGWVGPPWLKAGWFHAAQLFPDAVADEAATAQRLERGEYQDAVERINLERQLVGALNRRCDRRVAGYFVKHQYLSAEFSNGIENIGFDSMDGLNSPTFIRTVKLKDFPWNGWLRLAIDAPADAAWNPIAGFSDDFGRLLWAAIGDPALFPAPYDSGPMLNRIADVQAELAR